MSIAKVAVIGAGVMGSDVSLNLTVYNFPVILVDINDKALRDARDKMKADFRMYKMMNPDFKDITFDAAVSNIEFTTSYDGLDAVDLVIENVVENWDVKKVVYETLRSKCNENCLYAVNTSCISITKIAALLPVPQNVIGVHFMNPVPLKKTVEVIRGRYTSAEMEQSMTAFLSKIGKTAIVVNDSPGFVSNRLSHLFMNEAISLVQEGVATPEQIDNIFKSGYGHKMGPLETADLIGLDTVMNSLAVLYESYQDTKFRCCPLLLKMVDAGLLGKKSGQGFYKY